MAACMSRRKTTHHRDHDFAFEMNHLQRVFARAFALGALGALAGCGGTVESTGGGDDAGPTVDGSTPAHDAGHDASVVDATPTCAQQTPWTFACDPSRDGGAFDASTGPDSDPLPPCDALNYNDRDACKAYCYGPTAKGKCDHTPTEANANYLECYEPQGQPPGTIYCAIELPGGRRHADYVAPAPNDGAIGDWLARLAHLEAASVDAFRILRDDLIAHGAPSYLADAADRSIGDETRHAAVMRRFAEAHGAEATPPERAEHAPRSLFAIARENAVEGCVRETFGALVAMWQAATASDPRFRRAMERIAEDEARHAALAWRVASWASTRLTPEENARVAEAMRVAEAELDAEIARAATDDSSHATRWLGLPSGRAAAALRQAFSASREGMRPARA